ncbi:hypothetical protein [Pseudidiomarina sediminum]|uniref:hypothetical protein n=1 Tax=Pseudidiomarina sediminum TaxID=431675 RepID=UPI001C9444F6|nr:hypothetical protein [Pseudidiomarina sediminum]MBY6063328.1 hypothetical protein [Pseudidiomarina sediminum]
MNPTTFTQLMRHYQFQSAAEIVLSADRFQFIDTQPLSGCGFVYLWVEVGSDDFTIVYVGKAGNTLKQRYREHRNGLHGGSGSGRKNAALFKAGMANGKRYFVYARKSPEVILHDQCVPSEVLEELAFMQKFKGALWNRT